MNAPGTAISESVSRERAITRLAYSCMLMVGINSGWTGPFIPEIARTLGVPIERAGLMVSAGAAGGFISVLIAGEIHQQLSAQKILVGAMAFSRRDWPGSQSLLALRYCSCANFLIGLANGGIDIGANAIIVELNRERLASALNYLHVLFGVGALLGPLIVSAAFAGHVDYWWVFGGGAMACAAIAMGLRLTPAVAVQTELVGRQRRRKRLSVDALASADLGAQRRDVHVRRLGTRHRRVAVSLPADGGSAEPHARVVGRLALLARTGLRARIRRTHRPSNGNPAIHDAVGRAVRARDCDSNRSADGGRSGRIGDIPDRLRLRANLPQHDCGGRRVDSRPRSGE